MRTIKFEYGFSSVNGIIKKQYYLHEIPSIKEKCDVWNVLPIAYVRQFTGLIDKNGKEIYEGDVLQLKKLDGSVLLYKIFSVKGGFAFNTHQDDFHKPQSKIYFYESTSDMQNSGFISTLEIIGNIYENHELLENKFAD